MSGADRSDDEVEAALDRVRAGFSSQGFMRTLGARLVNVEPGACAIAVPYSESVTQQHGFFHGGVTATLADNAAGFAAHSLMSAAEEPLSVEFKVNLVAPAQGEWLEARATVIRAGRRLKHTKVQIFARSGDQEELVAVALGAITSRRMWGRHQNGPDESGGVP